MNCRTFSSAKPTHWRYPRSPISIGSYRYGPDCPFLFGSIDPLCSMLGFESTDYHSAETGDVLRRDFDLFEILSEVDQMERRNAPARTQDRPNGNGRLNGNTQRRKDS